MTNENKLGKIALTSTQIVGSLGSFAGAATALGGLYYLLEKVENPDSVVAGVGGMILAMGFCALGTAGMVLGEKARDNIKEMNNGDYQRHKGYQGF